MMMSKDKASGGGYQQRPPPEEVAKCPRCDSTNTKFCYYNNYSLTQPRHFCKACKRYWTKGGTQRNVPIGGGCRKNNKRTNESISKLSSHDFKDPNASSHFGGLKFFHGFSPAMEFQPGSIGGGGELPFSAFQSSATASVYNSNIASSIEYLSYVNQDMHWKFQQQRLASLFGKERNKDGDGGEVSTLAVTTVFENEKLQAQKPLQPMSFQDLTNMKGCMSGGSMTTEWFFGNSYPATATTTTTTTSATNQSGSNENENTSNWNGFQAWTDLHQYNVLP